MKTLDEKGVWVIEAKNGGEWYPCWYDLYYSKKMSLEELNKLLRSPHNGFNLGRKNYRTRRYVRAK